MNSPVKFFKKHTPVILNDWCPGKLFIPWGTACRTTFPASPTVTSRKSIHPGGRLQSRLFFRKNNLPFKRVLFEYDSCSLVRLAMKQRGYEVEHTPFNLPVSSALIAMKWQTCPQVSLSAWRGKKIVPPNAQREFNCTFKRFTVALSSIAHKNKDFFQQAKLSKPIC